MNAIVVTGVIVFLVLLALPTIRDFAAMLRTNDQLHR
jgi:hypothetical protein